MKDTTRLNQNCDTLYPSGSSIGFLTFLSDTLNTGAVFTIDSDLQTLVFPFNHNLVTGSRFRVSSTGAYPIAGGVGSLNSTTDYYFIKTDATHGKLATNQANAQSNTAVTFSDQDTGPTLTINEQDLSVNDLIEVLLNKEVTDHPDVTSRFEIAGLPSASNGQKNLIITLVTSSGSPNFVYKHILLIIGGSTTFGNTSGYKDHLFTESSTRVLPGNSTNNIGITLSLSN